MMLGYGKWVRYIRQREAEASQCLRRNRLGASDVVLDFATLCTPNNDRLCSFQVVRRVSEFSGSSG